MPEPGMVPRVLVVTDRRRLAAQTGAELAEWPALLTAQVAGALAGGADLIQIREPDLAAGVLLQFLRTLFARLPGSAARVVVNDRADVAWAARAAGVHLGDRSLPLTMVRSLPAARSWVVGRSVHSAAVVPEAREATYLLAGTVRQTEAKPPGWRTLGWEGLAEIVRAADKLPVVAIGGLRPEHADAVTKAGAAGVAAIGWFLPEPGAEIESSVAGRVRDMRNALGVSEEPGRPEE